MTVVGIPFVQVVCRAIILNVRLLYNAASCRLAGNTEFTVCTVYIDRESEPDEKCVSM